MVIGTSGSRLRYGIVTGEVISGFFVGQVRVGLFWA